jgi:hypothetical protein
MLYNCLCAFLYFCLLDTTLPFMQRYMLKLLILLLIVYYILN